MPKTDPAHVVTSGVASDSALALGFSPHVDGSYVLLACTGGQQVSIQAGAPLVAKMTVPCKQSQFTSMDLSGSLKGLPLFILNPYGETFEYQVVSR
jgi:hypothetical protein